jgi:hypothetical protein
VRGLEPPPCVQLGISPNPHPHPLPIRSEATHTRSYLFSHPRELTNDDMTSFRWAVTVNLVLADQDMIPSTSCSSANRRQIGIPIFQ